MARTVSDLNLEQLRKLKGLKEQFAIGEGTGDKELQAQASKAADELRKSAGITAGSAGQYSLAEINKMIAGRLPTETVQTDTDTMQRRLTQEQERARIAGLRRAKEAGLSALKGEEETIAPAFAEARRQTRATSERQAQQFRDFLAQRGLTSAGGAALGETQRLGAQQAALGGLGRQETAALGDIARRRAGIEAGFATDVEAARAGIQAEALQRQLAGQQLAQQEQTRAQQQAFENALAQAQLTGQYQGVPTLAGRQAELAEREFANAQARLRQAQATAAITPELPQAQLLTNLNELRRSFQTPLMQRRGVSSGSGAIAYIADNYDRLVQNYGKQAVDQFTSELVGVPTPEAEPITTTGYKTSPDFAEDLSRIINATIEERQLLKQQLQANAQAFITQYGVDGYNALLAQAEAF